MSAEVKISPDITLVVQMGFILVLTFILNKIFFKPLVKILHERKEHVDSAIKAKEEKHGEVIKLTEKYERSILEARQKALVKCEDIRKENLERERVLLETAHKEHADAIHDAKLRANKEFEDAQKEVSAHVKALSVNVAEKILQRKV